jgi:membrane fusion protein (multidrug efflux system)
MSRAEPRPSRARATIWAASVGIAVALAATGGCKGDKEKQPAQAPPPAVVVAEVVQKTVPIYGEFVAQTEANTTVELRARVEGFLQKVAFKEGSRVKKGDLLFQIDPRPYEAAVQEAVGRLERAKALLEKSRADVERLRPLWEQDAVPKQDLDNAEAAQKASVANVLLEEANLTKARLDLGYTDVRSPIDGIIGRLGVNVGNLVGKTDATLLATVSSADPLYVNFSISETDYLSIAKRLKSQAQPEARKGIFELLLADNSIFPHKGDFGLVERALDARTGTLTLRTIFPNPEGLLRPGQFGRIRVVVEERPNAILVPQRAVQEIQGAKSVLVVGPDDMVALRTITPAESVGEFLIVRDGVKPGDRVIVEGIQKARPGSKVSPSAAPVSGKVGEKAEEKTQGKAAGAPPPGKAEGK